MAVYALTSEYVAIASQDYSNKIKSATLTVDVADLDTTNFDSAGWTEVIGGLKSGTLSITAMSDMAAGEIDADLWALLGTVATFEVRATDSAVGANNPKFTGSILINSASVGGAVGELAMAGGYSFPTTGAVTRATS